MRRTGASATVQAPSFRHSTFALFTAATNCASLGDALICSPARTSVALPDRVKFVIS